MAVVGRVTQGLLVSRQLSNLNRQLGRIAILQEQLSTGLRVNRPSDDPIDARRAISVRNSIANNEQFLSNISDVGPQLEESASALLNLQDILVRSLELTVQAGSDTLSQEQLDSIALEIDQLLESAAAEANHRTNNRSIFAGTATLADAFDVTRVGDQITDVTYAGNDQDIEINISDGVRTAINITGTEAFLSNVDVFDVLIGIRDDLLAGDQDSLRTTRLDELETAQEQTLFGVAKIGAIQNRVERVSGDLQDYNIQLEILLSDKLDADYAETVLEMSVAENAFIAALDAASRVLQPNLLQFLR